MKIMLEGRNTVLDALVSEAKVLEVKVAHESSSEKKIKEIMDLAAKSKVKLTKVSSRLLQKESGSDRPQNVLALIEIEEKQIEEILEEKEAPFILVYNTLDYEHNLGAILRTSWGLGVDAVVVSTHGVHEVTPVVAKVSMGGAVHVPLISESLFSVLKKIKKYGIPIVGVEPGLGVECHEQNLLGPVVLVFGGEDSGLSEPLRKYCDLFVEIPMMGGLSSFNVSVATGILCYEKLRQEKALLM